MATLANTQDEATAIHCDFFLSLQRRTCHSVGKGCSCGLLCSKRHAHEVRNKGKFVSNNKKSNILLYFP